MIGWDVGGAHMKAARAENGRIVSVVQLPCPLWLGPDRLTDAIGAVLERLGPAEAHATTMTGELADIFPDRADGVERISQALADAVGQSRLALYGGRAGFLPPSAAHSRAEDIASANWHASAALTGRFVPEGLFVDIGSTTTDLIPVSGGGVCAAGYTDRERLGCGELVYTGLTRTPVRAMAGRAPVAGTWVSIAAELFATSADVYRILGELPQEADQMPAADSREKTVVASCARLARMVGADAGDASWRDLAAWFAEAQLRQVVDGAMLVSSRAVLRPEAPVVGAGAGQHLAARLAARLGRPYVDFSELIAEVVAPDAGRGVSPAQCVPAIAMALLPDQGSAPA